MVCVCGWTGWVCIPSPENGSGQCLYPLVGCGPNERVVPCVRAL